MNWWVVVVAAAALGLGWFASDVWDRWYYGRIWNRRHPK